MKIVAVKSAYLAKELFSSLGEVTVYKEGSLTPEKIRDANILVVRSTQKINSALLEGSSVKFVGTATIGHEHLDTDYFKKAGIKCCSSPGCNAQGVAEYITSALLSLANKHSNDLSQQTIGIIGVGNVGSRVARVAQALSMNVLLNDPPRQKLEDNSTEFVDIETILERSDIVTLHVPLTHDGEYATYNMANNDFFSKMKSGATFINCSRGAIVNEDALLDAIDRGHIAHTVIDTWCDEPNINHTLMEKVDIATPHIAGHSLEGKARGTFFVYAQVCSFLNKEPEHYIDDFIATAENELSASSIRSGDSQEKALNKLVMQVYDIMRDDNALRSNPERFSELRAIYPIRREFQSYRINNVPDDLNVTTTCLGFKG